MFSITQTNGFFFNDALIALAALQQGGLPWWAWVLIIILIILLAVLLWWWSKKSKKKEEVFTPFVQAVSEPPAPPAPPVVEPVAPAKIDDLTIIEGIGPKISGVLRSAGVTTFQQLANAEVSQITTILHDADLRLADPATWAEQAKLAAENKWDELKALQDSLKGGRHA